jgi:hypothetical protein
LLQPGAVGHGPEEREVLSARALTFEGDSAGRALDPNLHFT